MKFFGRTKPKKKYGSLHTTLEKERIVQAKTRTQEIRDLLNRLEKQAAKVKQTAKDHRSAKEQLHSTISEIASAINISDDFDNMFFSQYQTTQDIVEHLQYDTSSAVLQLFSHNLRSVREQTQSCEELNKTMRSTVLQRRELAEKVDSLAHNKHRDRATGKLLVAQQELLIVSRNLELLQAKVKSSTKIIVAGFTEVVVNGMIELILRQETHFKRQISAVNSCELLINETKDDLLSYQSNTKIELTTDSDKIKTLEKLVRNADGTSSFSSICENMMEPINPLFLRGEGVIFVVRKVLWMPVCLESGGSSSVPGILIFTNYRISFCPYTNDVKGSNNSSRADDMLSRNRRRRRMSARAGTQKYGVMVNINAYKLQQRKAISRRMSTRNSLFNKNGTRSSRSSISSRSNRNSTSSIVGGEEYRRYRGSSLRQEMVAEEGNGAEAEAEAEPMEFEEEGTPIQLDLAR